MSLLTVRITKSSQEHNYINTLVTDIAVGSALYLPFLELGPNQVFLPESDDGTSGPIPLPEFSFWSTSRTQVYVRTLLYV